MASIAQPQQAAFLHDSRFDRRLFEILDFAIEVFAQKGYEGASMRDLSRLSGISLAGLYYYFESKEKLLYFIQRHTLTTIIERLRTRLSAESDSERRLRIFVHTHVEYSLERPEAMKVLSHEDDVLRDAFGAELAEIKREYYQLCLGLVDELMQREHLNTAADYAVRLRTAVMSLFGTMNWLYTWHKPGLDPGAEAMAQLISDLFLQGLRGVATGSGGCPAPGKHAPRVHRKKRFSRSAHE